MAKVYINDVLATLASKIVYNRNRQEATDVGAITVLNTRSSRYEPYSRVTLWDEATKYEHYLVESDQPLLLKNGLWEHKLTLIENIAIFSTIFPVDRQFTRLPALTIKKILLIYQRELEFYQDFLFDFDDADTIYNEVMIDKQYQAADFAVVVYDLFRKINAIPRVKWVSNKWYLYYELYIERNAEVTVSADSRQSDVNDIDYATEVLSKTRNALSEDNNGVWFPSKTGWITPRSKSTMLQTSDLQFEFVDDISVLYQAVGLVPCKYETYPGGVLTYIDVDIIVDFTSAVFQEKVYKDLEVSPFYNKNRPPFEIGETPVYYKQNTIYYNSGSNVIEGLYWKKDGVIFDQNIEALYTAVLQFIYQAANEQIESFNPLFLIVNTLDIYDMKCRFNYRPQRNIDYITEKHDIVGFNKTTIMNNQKDGAVELSRYMENSSAIANRIGNEIKNITQTFDTWASAWVLGDYFITSNEYWVITNIRYVVDKNVTNVIADFTKDFININRESGISREPSPFVYTGKSLVSNFIYRDYLVLYTGTTTRISNSNILLSRRVVMNIFDYNSTYNKPLKNAQFLRLGSSKYINMPIYSVGGGNTILLHMTFNDSRIAGFALKKMNDAWYRDPVYYVDSNDDLDSGRIYLTDDIILFDDTSSYKYYPEIPEQPSLVSQPFNLPFDKDPNDILAITYELIVFSEDNDIVIPNGFAKFNNLIRYFDSTPTISVYSDTEPYTTFDKYVRGTVVTGAIITLTSTTLTVTDSLGAAIEYWCIVYDGEIILAANNDISVIKYLLTKDRSDYAIDTNIDYDLQALISFNLNVDVFMMESIVEAFRDTDRIAVEVITTVNQLVSLLFRENDRIAVTYEALENTDEPLLSFVSWSDIGGGFYEYTFTAKNNDEITATIYSDSNATPVTSKGLVASQSSVTFAVTSNLTSITMYARALADGKNYSTIDSAVGTIV